ncbi:MAG: hypothetical protein ACOY4K_14175 [Pseudomonadota bacterium]
MAKLDAANAAFAGFSLISRRPLAVVGWAVFIFVVGVLPAFGLLSAMGSSLAELIRLGESGADPTPEQIMPMMSTIYAMNPILWVTSLVMRVVLAGAIFRAVLEPSQGRWAYLRLGMGELMIAVVTIVLSIMLGVGASVWVLLTVGVCLALWEASQPAAIGAGVVSGVALLVTMIWLLLRFSLAAPMSFAEKNFRLIESWKLTRGHAGGLLLMALILFVIMIIVEAVLMALFAGALAATGAGLVTAGGLDEAAIHAFFSQPPSVWMSALMPWIVVACIVGSLVGAAVSAIVTAPWAEAYRQLRGGGETQPEVLAA